MNIEKTVKSAYLTGILFMGVLAKQIMGGAILIELILIFCYCPPH